MSSPDSLSRRLVAFVGEPGRELMRELLETADRSGAQILVVDEPSPKFEIIQSLKITPIELPPARPRREGIAAMMERLGARGL